MTGHRGFGKLAKGQISRLSLSVINATVAALLISISCSAIAQDLAEHPFGHLDDADYQRLAEFAKLSKVDLNDDLQRTCARDEAALGRIFQLSLAFKTFDGNARAFGQLINDTFLNVAEVIGVEAYAWILDRQPVGVAQRVRDFLYYPAIVVDSKNRNGKETAEIRRAYPSIFSSSFEFGRGDPMFADIARDTTK